ncbi:septal ring lytic transglycosylase RlpA family protein [Cutibacterium sp. WCA-380-WT-3A]|uniref:Probable endolytic peptidoglycan transglycosylase RlpA n=1 Tax=Cutibacterium porci TaxID=2605781 RepID=A0A7K0J3I3_9ACTN|nr:septal ring lytic transglycosylase RlpA family protein [Cutibacterium porci]MSS44483.1 septal ring lytic transglycosylase RlpA family protein [Cutibacterium porci]
MTNTSTNAGTTFKRTVALTAAAGLAVMGTIAEEAHAAPTGTPGAHAEKAPAQQTKKAPTKQAKRATPYNAQFALSRVHLNVRSGHSTDYKRYGLIHPGDKLLIIGQDVQGWTPVNYRGKTAWVATRFITKVTRPVGIYAQRGDHNARSKAVQRDLSSLNYFPAKWVGLPYGPSTTNSVKVFQRANALKQTGVTDAVTLSLLKSKADAQRAAEAEKAAARKAADRNTEDSQDEATQRHSSSTSRSANRSTRNSSSDVSTSGIAGSCEASFYDDTQTASGESFSSSALTAASKTYAFGTRLKVTNKANGQSVVVRINDRGPYVSGRCLDLSPAAFSQISSPSAGVADVTYEKVS